MQVKHRVYAFLSAKIDDTVEMLKSALLQNTRVHIVLKVAIIEGQANAIKA